MNYARVKKFAIVFFVITLISVAYIFKLIGTFGWSTRTEFGIIRSVIYIVLFSMWGFYIHMRIVQKQVRRYLICIAAQMVFWIIIRTIKYSFINSPDLSRFIWYLYYLPMIFIPLHSLFVALSLGKSEEYKLPKKTLLLYIPAVTLLIAVLTNDFHQLVFSFFADAAALVDPDYMHEFLYYFIWAWAVCCIVAACILIVIKCRIPGKKKLIALPLIPIAALAIYGCMYIADIYGVMLLFSDFSVVFCNLIALAFEALLYCGLIQSNTHYRELFRCSGIRATILDSNYNVILSSNDTKPLKKAVIEQVIKAPVLLNDGVRISGSPITGGFVIWSEDVSEMTEVLNLLASVSEDLQEETSLLRENYNTERRIRHLEEQNRLYDEIHRQTSPQIALLADLIKKFNSESDDVKKQRLLRKMTVIGVYLKRRSNLVFIGEQVPLLDENELKLCFEEAMNNLELSGIECGCYTNLGGSVTLKEATAAFDFYERVCEASFDSLRSMLIRIYKSSDNTIISISVMSDADLSYFETEQVSVLQDDNNVCSLTLRIPKGGKR